MATTTPNYGWPVPTSTDYVKDGATAIEALGDAIDATVFGLATGKILQVVSTTKTDTFSMSSTTFADVTGLTATITPTSATSKILVMFSIGINADFNVQTYNLRLTRAGTPIGVGDAAGSRTQAFFPQMAGPTSNNVMSNHGSFLDSPATTSARTYAIQIKGESSGQAIYVNRSVNDPNAVNAARGISTITLMEVDA
jgi:hypothetical protein